VSVDPKVFDSPSTTIMMKTTTVTDTERELFLENVLFDQPFQLDISILRDTIVTIRSRSAYENALCFHCVRERALAEDGDNNKANTFDFLLWLQRYSVALAITTVGGKSFSSLQFSSEQGTADPDHARQLNEFVEAHLTNIPYPKWQMLLSAYMIFTVKEKLLLDNVGNRDFWNPAG